MPKKAKPKSITEYIAAAPKETREKLRQISDYFPRRPIALRQVPAEPVPLNSRRPATRVRDLLSSPQDRRQNAESAFYALHGNLRRLLRFDGARRATVARPHFLTASCQHSGPKWPSGDQNLLLGVSTTISRSPRVAASTRGAPNVSCSPSAAAARSRPGSSPSPA